MADDVTGAVRRTPRPYPSTEDHQTPETAPQGLAGGTNTASPVSGDQLDVSSRVSSQAGCWPLDRDVDRVVAEFAALPECTACGGSGKDDHATVFEQRLAVHFAGPPVKAEGRRRQLCMWCGHVLRDVPSTPDAPPPWPDGALVRVEDGLGEVVPYEPGAELPPGCCALPDDDYDRADDGLCEKCVGPAVDDPDGLGLCRQHLTEHYAAEADAERQADEELDDGPDEAQETRAAADWPAEPVDTHADEQEADRA